MGSGTLCLAAAVFAKMGQKPYNLRVPFSWLKAGEQDNGRVK